MADEVTKKQLGRYTILYELGHGAMGTVYRGHDPHIDREVALKTISLQMMGAEDEEQFRQRFLREARAAGRLTHPGIVAMHDAGEDEATRTPYLVMEFVTGITLEELGAGGELAREKGLDLVKQIAEALDYAHRRSIIHRDIKPANILVTPEGRAKITDFGIAKLATSKFTQTGLLMGTPAFMSPEQLTAGPIDGRSDLFSLGTILYWLLSGKRPFGGDTLAALSYSVVHTAPPPLVETLQDLSPDLDYIVGRALAKDPAQRYQSGREMADDLEDLMDGRSPRSRATGVAAAPLLAPAAPTTQRLPTPLTPTAAPTVITPPVERLRVPRWLLLAAVVALLLLLIAGGLLRLSRRAAESAAEPGTGKPAGSGTSSASPASRPRVAGVATLHLQGWSSLEKGTLSVFADGKPLESFALSAGAIAENLRVPADTRSIAIRVRGTTAGARGGWVPPGQRRKRRSAEGEAFDQTESLSTRFKPGEARTLGIRVNGGLNLRWLD